MFNQTAKNNNTDPNQEISQLADMLEDLLKSSSTKAKEDVEDARKRAKALLQETHAKMQGPNCLTRAAKETGEHVDDYVREKPWHGVGIGAALGILVGALLASPRSRR